VLGTFPSYFTIIAVGLEKGFSAVTELDVAGMFLTPERLFSRADTDMRSALNMKMSLVFSLCAAGLVALHLFNWEKTLFRALARNARIPQIIYHGGLLFLGMLLAAHFTDTALSIDFFHVLGAIVLVLAVAFAWLASVVVNDLFDVAIDRETNAWRPLPTETIDSPTYATIGFLFFFFSLLFAGVVSFSALLLLLCYQAIAFLYSAPPLRLKRIPGLASLFSALAVLLVFFAGYVTVAPARDIAALPLPIVFLLLCAFAIALPLKDFKDITGDRRDGVLTIPVLFGEDRAKLLLGALTFILFTVSVRILNLPAALFPAFLLGALAGYIILRSGSPRLPYRFLPGIVLAIVAAYGFVLLILAA
jgi:4-hydroxybenzoate polyprenyltransferase